MNDFSGKTVIVTGGAKGIGEGVTRAFAQAGANVFSADVDTAAGARIEAESASLPGSITFVNADVSQAATCEALVRQAAVNGGVDVLVNNVGIQPVDSYLPAHEFPEETWDRILAVNLKSGFLMSKVCGAGDAEKGRRRHRQYRQCARPPVDERRAGLRCQQGRHDLRLHSSSPSSMRSKIFAFWRSIPAPSRPAWRWKV